jgi:hypothetical protein
MKQVIAYMKPVWPCLFEVVLIHTKLTIPKMFLEKDISDLPWIIGCIYKENRSPDLCSHVFREKTLQICSELLETPKKSCEGRKRFTFNKLTSPGGSLEVQDEGKFFAEP